MSEIYSETVCNPGATVMTNEDDLDSLCRTVKDRPEGGEDGFARQAFRQNGSGRSGYAGARKLI